MIASLFHQPASPPAGDRPFRPPTGEWWIRLGFVLAVGFSLLGLALYPPPSLEQQWRILLPMLILSGIPHGGLDLLVLRDLLGRRWERERGFALGLYALLALGVVALWWMAPAFSLGAFLLAAVWHFGRTDALAHARAGLLPTLARGALPVTLSALWHPREIELLFGFLVPDSAAVWLARQAALAALAALPVLAIDLALGMWRDGRYGLLAALEAGVLVGLYGSAPPLLAFGLYFCWLHAPRSTRRLLGRLEAAAPCAERATAAGSFLPPGRGRRLSAALWPTLAAGLAIGGGALYLTARAGADWTAGMTSSLFIGLAALTWPHLLLHALWDRTQPPSEIEP